MSWLRYASASAHELSHTKRQLESFFLNFAIGSAGNSRRLPTRILLDFLPVLNNMLEGLAQIYV